MGADQNRQERVEELFHELAELPEAQREARLLDRCAGDADLEREVAHLLRCLSAGGENLEAPVVLLPSDDALPTGERLGAYRIIRLLGEGGMGQVFEAEQDFPRRRVALKVIRGSAATPAAIRRFEYEASALAQLKHPDIAQIYEAGFFDSGRPGPFGGRRPYFAMELIKGRRLDEFAAGLNPRAVLGLMARVADGVHHAHQRGVIHRDLKPANILVESDGVGSADADAAGPARAGSPKILDFGVARLTGDAGGAGDRAVATETGQMVGTVAYMSPEQLRGHTDDIDTRCDVYALGVILYQLLASRLPHDIEGSSIFDAAKMILEREPVRLGAIDRDLRGDVETIVATAMHKDRERRYASAAELAADIRRFLNNEPIAARPASAGYQLRKFAARNRTIVGASAVAAAALVIGVVGLGTGLVRARDAEREARRLATNEAEARASAERRFAQVRTLARTLITEVYDAIEPLAGATEAKQKIIETGLSYTDGLAAESGGDPGLQLELAGAYGRIAELLGDPAKPNLGKTADAIKQAEQAVSLIEEVASRDPDNMKVQGELFAALERRGALLRVSGRMEDSLATYTRAAEIAARRSRAMPDDQAAEEAALRADAGLGRMKEGMGRPGEAIEHYERYRAYTLRRAGENLENAMSAANAVVMGLKIGEALTAVDRNADAERELREAASLCERVLKQHPDNAKAMGLQSSLARAITYVLTDLERADEAAAEGRRAVEIDRVRIERDPADRMARRSLATSLFSLGYALEKKEQCAEALATFEEYQRVADANASQDPTQTSIQHDAALARVSAARMLNRLSRFEEARSLAQQSLAMHERMLGAEPRNSAWMIGLLDDLYVLCTSEIGVAGRDQRTLEDRHAGAARARALLDRAETMAQSMLDSGTSAPQAQRKLDQLRGLRKDLVRLEE